MKTVQVAVPRPLDRFFTYSYPERWKGKIQVGSRVEVDFHHKKTLAWVVAVDDEVPTNFPRHLIKPVFRVLEYPAACNRELMSLGKFLAEETLADLGEALSAVVPSYSFPRPPASVFLRADFVDPLAEISNRAKKQKAAVEALIKAGSALSLIHI